MSVIRLEVRDLECNAQESKIARNSRQYLKIPVYGAETVQLFWLKTEAQITSKDSQVQEWVSRIFQDPILQEAHLQQPESFRFVMGGSLVPTFVVEVRFLPGVTDNVGKTATEALHLLSNFARENDVQVYTGKAVYLYGDISRSEAEKIASEIVANPLIENVSVKAWNTYFSEDRFHDQDVPEVHLEESTDVEIIAIDRDDRELEKLSKERCWALSLAEIKAVQKYFADPLIREKRRTSGLPENPTDVEIEVIAQTWSEHCKHKIFNAEIDYTEKNVPETFPRLGNFTVKSIFKTYIRGVTQEVEKERNLPWLVSVFTDNAGIVRFDEKVDVCVKVETHNSPSALDPYGGALTGIVGVNRDILGCGLGARPIANTDVFCFAPPDWPALGDERELPEGLKHPRRIFDGVHLGVEDGGNKSGIPTVNGAFAFHKNYSGKPLVFCGTIGVLPQKLPDGRDCSGKGQKPGDKIVMAGGRIGKDGIHGATFSSMELTEGAPATVVQIGDPITQKRLADFLLEARDLGLFTSLTDNGAGGLSSSVGEMAGLAGGARLDVTHAPVKYPGLKPYELVVSESQERMTFSVAEEKIPAFLALAKRRGVEASVLGDFTDSGFFEVVYKGKLVAQLSLEFLHDGLPPMVLKANWDGAKKEETLFREEEVPEISVTDFHSRAFHERALSTLLSRWNIRSKEEWVRRYDHEVQAATVVKPFVGAEAHGPSDGGVIWMAPHGGEQWNGLSVGCGLAPKLSRFDAYLSAQHALDEAVRNLVAMGTNPEQIALVDNFCWPDPLVSEKNPEAVHKLAQLVRANKALYDLAKIYGAPFVSGKDSMKNDFTGRSRFGKDIRISVPPTVLVTAFGRVPDVRLTVTSDFKNPGDLVYLIGKNTRHLGGSELEESFELPKGLYLHTPPLVEGAENFRLYRTVYSAIQKGIFRSVHDCSEGGMLVALAESCIGGNLGLRSELEFMAREFHEYGGSLAEFFFHETPGRFVVSVAPEKEEELRKLFSAQSCIKIGEVSKAEILRFTRSGLVTLDAQGRDLKRAWKGER